MNKLPKFQLPVWMDKGEPLALQNACATFWQKVLSWLMWPSHQSDPMTCAESLLPILAYQRDITRFRDEPLSLFRARVKYAFINAQDAGSVAGFIRIFERLGIGYIEILERQPDIDWDVIILRVTDSQISGYPDLLMNIVSQYGRTCRRYRFEVLTSKSLLMRVGHVTADYHIFCAQLQGEN
nr:phage tail protein [Photorhabdus tasmaniensis]